MNRKLLSFFNKSKKKLRPLFFCLISFTVSFYYAQAYEVNKTVGGKPLHWEDTDIPVPFSLNLSTATVANGTEAILYSFSAWEQVPTARIAFSYQGSNNRSEFNRQDGHNTLFWIKENWSTIIGASTSVVARTRTWYNTSTGIINEADISFNGENYTWSTNPQGVPDTVDLQSLATHEIGHFCGLADVYASDTKEFTMYGYYSYGEIKKRTLAEDDKAGISFLYPLSTSTRTPVITNIPTPTPTPTKLMIINADLNNDGQINQLDLIIFCNYWHKTR